MKSKIALLPKSAKAVLPGKVGMHVGLHNLKPLTLKLLVVAVHRWERRSFELKNIPPSKRTIDCFRFQVKLRELHANLNEDGQPHNRNYKYVREAISDLSRFQVVDDSENTNLFQATKYSENKSEIIYTLSWYFARALEALDRKKVNFTMIPVADALALSDSRQLLMLFLASRFEKTYVPTERQATLKWLREYFGLQHSRYDEPRFVLQTLREIAASVKAKTNFDVTVIKIKDRLDERRISEVQFNVKRKTKPKLPDPGFKDLGAKLAADDKHVPLISVTSPKATEPETTPKASIYRDRIALRAKLAAAEAAEVEARKPRIVRKMDYLVD
jgi:hypothetical protein